MYEDIVTLIKTTTTGRDKAGNPIKETVESDVYVQPQGVYNAEFYNAAQVGLKPSITFLISNREDYNNESMLRYHNALYNIIRVDWTAQRDSIRLICEKRVGVR